MEREKENGYWITDWSGVISDDRPLIYTINKDLAADYNFSLLTYQEWASNSKSNVVEFLRSKGVEISEEDKDEIWEKHEDMLNKLEKIGFRPTIYPGAKTS